MRITWVLVADSQSAKLYERSQGKSPQLLRTFSPDKFNANNGENCTRYITPLSAAEEFAQQLSTLLERARYDELFDSLVLVSSKRFQGQMKPHMSIELKRLTRAYLDTDYAHTPADVASERMSTHTPSIREPLSPA
jgi:protein required for attachment to host cells